MSAKTGLELGIRAPLRAVKKAAKIADAGMLDYYFVPETHPKFAGVDALKALDGIAAKIENVILGTAIINVFSRNKKNMLELARRIYQKVDGRFVLGLGTSAPVIIENIYNVKFEKPIFRIKSYTEYIKNHYRGPVYWAAVGDRVTGSAAKYADGTIFFLKPEREIKRSIKIIKNELIPQNRKYSQFGIISIRPTYVDDYEKNGKNAAKMTIASYVGANEFYSKPLEKAGFKKEVRMIRENFLKQGLTAAATQVSDKMVKELATFGSAKKCAMEINEYADRTKIKTVIAGFDLPKNGYNNDFFKNLHKLTSRL